MNFGIITSFIIAGMILLSIATVNWGLQNSTVELTLTQITREHVKNISELVSNDIQKIGANKYSKIGNAIITADSNKIEFLTNIDLSADESVERITWEFTNKPVTSSDNPNDFLLTRIVRSAASGAIIDSTSIPNGVTKFLIRYYDGYGRQKDDFMANPNANKSDIKQINVELMVQSKQELTKNASSAGTYIKSVWDKRFSPPNLEDN